MSVVVIMRHGIACRAQLCKIHDKDYTILIGVRSMYENETQAAFQSNLKSTL